MKHYAEIPEYYDAEYAHQDMLQNDVPFFLGQLPHRRQHILELAAGTARAAIPMAIAGHRVVGVDRDRHMLARAARKCASLGPAAKRIELIESDVLNLDLARRFDWVCLFFNTFLLFTSLEQQDKLLQAVQRHLKPAGRFWLDIFQPNLVLLAQERSENLDPTFFHVPELDRTVYKTTEVRRDPARQAQRIAYHYTWFDAAGREYRRSRSFDLTFLFPRELQLLLERNGLFIERMYGNYDGSALNADSPRIIVRARRT